MSLAFVLKSTGHILFPIVHNVVVYIKVNSINQQFAKYAEFKCICTMTINLNLLGQGHILFPMFLHMSKLSQASFKTEIKTMNSDNNITIERYMPNIGLVTLYYITL